jgi:hypothetical protein
MSKLAWPLFLLSSCFWGGCKLNAPVKDIAIPLSQRITWEGRQAVTYFEDTTKGNYSFTFLGIDTVYLKLQDFSQEYLAYAAFSAKASPHEISDGYYRDKSNLVFFHGRFLGEIQYAHSGLIPAHFFKSNLTIKDEELFLLPTEFNSFPALGRIAKSERVQTTNFMGINWGKPVFSAQYLCHGDTAMAFRVLGVDSRILQLKKGWIGRFDTLKLGDEILFQGQNNLQEPLVYESYPDGILGIIGCFDPELSLAYAKKLKKMTVLLNKP